MLRKKARAFLRGSYSDLATLTAMLLAGWHSLHQYVCTLGFIARRRRADAGADLVIVQAAPAACAHMAVSATLTDASTEAAQLCPCTCPTQVRLLLLRSCAHLRGPRLLHRGPRSQCPMRSASALPQISALRPRRKRQPRRAPVSYTHLRAHET